MWWYKGQIFSLEKLLVRSAVITEHSSSHLNFSCFHFLVTKTCKSGGKKLRATLSAKLKAALWNWAAKKMTSTSQFIESGVSLVLKQSPGVLPDCYFWSPNLKINAAPVPIPGMPAAQLYCSCSSSGAWAEIMDFLLGKCHQGLLPHCCERLCMGWPSLERKDTTVRYQMLVQLGTTYELPALEQAQRQLLRGHRYLQSHMRSLSLF